MEKRLGRAIAWWVQMVAHARLWVLGIFVVLTAVSLSYTVNNLQINTDLADMLSAKLPFRQTYETYKRAFPQHIDNVVVVIEAETPELAREATKKLVRHLKAKDSLFKTIHDPSTNDFFERQALLYMEVPELEAQADLLADIQPFLGRLTQDQSLRGLLGMLGDALEAVLDGESIDLEPILTRVNEAVEANLNEQHYRVSWQELMLGDNADRDDRRQFIVVQPRMDHSLLLPAETGINAIRSLAHELKLTATDGLRLRLTGTAALEYEELESVSRGAGIAVVLALTMVLIVLSIGLRSIRLVVATLVTLLVGLMLTAGFATLAVGKLNLISIAFAVLYIGLGVDFAIHLCLRYRELLRAGVNGHNALISSARSVGTALALCAVTTAIGFYAFLPTAYSGVSELGLISGTGMFISLMVTLTLQPALLSVWPARVASAHAASHTGALKRGVTELPYRHAKAVRWGALAMGLVALLVLPQASFDYNPINLRDPTTESVATFKDLAADGATSIMSATLLAANAATAAQYQRRLEELESVQKTVSIGDFVPEEQADKLAVIEDMALILGPELDPSKQRAPASSEEQLQAIADFDRTLATYLQATASPPWRGVAERLKANLDALRNKLAQNDSASVDKDLADLQASLLQYLPQSLSLMNTALAATEFTSEDLPPEVVARWVSDEGAYRVTVFPEEDLGENTALRRFVSDIQEVAPETTDDPVISLRAAEVVVSAFQQAFAGALIVITLILLIILRSPLDALLVLVPLLLAGLVTTGTLIIIGTDFNFANIIALPLLLGMGVDNGIHMVNRMRAEGWGKSNVLQTSTARGVFFSALTTVVSFGNLIFSSHPGTASMGVILTLGILFTLFSTLIVLPALASLRRRSRPRAA